MTRTLENWVEESAYNTIPCSLIESKQMTALEKYFKFALPEGTTLPYQPGQFVMIAVPGIGEAPISISSSPTRTDGHFELVVRRAGSLTGALHDLDVGATVGIRGPFGRGFPTDLLAGKDLLFIGGGCGNIPLHSLINYVMDNRKDYGELSILLGCKTPQSMLFLDEVDEWEKKPDVNLKCTVDEADERWKGEVGLITKLIPQVKIDPHKTYAVVVGPPIMYKFVIKELKAAGLPDHQIVVSLERHMKCGVGKCGHCQIGNLYCCQEGPVFLYEEIKHNSEAI